MLPSLLTFVASLAVLLAAARVFTHSAERVGLALGMSPFAVGVLIVSAGISLPELVAALVAAGRGTSEIVIGKHESAGRPFDGIGRLGVEQVAPGLRRPL